MITTGCGPTYGNGLEVYRVLSQQQVVAKQQGGVVQGDNTQLVLNSGPGAPKHTAREGSFVSAGGACYVDNEVNKPTTTATANSEPRPANGDDGLISWEAVHV